MTERERERPPSPPVKLPPSGELWRLKPVSLSVVGNVCIRPLEPPPAPCTLVFQSRSWQGSKTKQNKKIERAQ